jgi:hypothetical protein
MIATITATALSIITSVLAFILQNLVRENQRLRDDRRETREIKQKAIGDGVLSLLRIQLIEYHDKYMTEEDIPSYVYENWDEMYSAYEALGGNGMVKRMKEDVDRLRLRR